MKITDINTKRDYYVEFGLTGSAEQRYICPICSNDRRKANEKCLAWSPSEKVGYCHHCNASFIADGSTNKNKIRSDEFSITPIWKLKETLTNYENNILIKTLIDRFGVNAINELFKKFFIGTGSGKYEGWTIFWQVDHKGYIRTGHLMQYNGLSRTKYQTWTHSLTEDKYILRQCLFGLNQLKDIPSGKTINVVESEKTALIGSVYFPNETWMATSGSNGLRPEKLLPLYSHPVHLYPDTNSIVLWSDISRNMKNVNVIYWQGDFFGYSREIEKLDLGADIADFLICHSIAELNHFSLN